MFRKVGLFFQGTGTSGENWRASRHCFPDNEGQLLNKGHGVRTIMKNQHHDHNDQRQSSGRSVLVNIFCSGLQHWLDGESEPVPREDTVFVVLQRSKTLTLLLYTFKVPLSWSALLSSWIEQPRLFFLSCWMFCFMLISKSQASYALCNFNDLIQSQRAILYYRMNPIHLGMARCLPSADCTIKMQTVSQPVTYVNQHQCSRSVTLVSLCDVGPPFQSQDQRYRRFPLRMVIFSFVERCSACICYTNTLNNCECYISNCCHSFC